MDAADWDWKTGVRAWAATHRLPGSDQTEAIESFFQNAFERTHRPDNAWFGLHKSSISLVVGGIYLAAIETTKRNRGFWLLVDQDHPTVAWIEFSPVLSTSRSKNSLVWAHSPQFSSLTSLMDHQEIWHSYASASTRIQDFPIAQDRDSTQRKRGKKRLSEILGPRTITHFESNFRNAVAHSLQSSSEARRKRLSEASAIAKPIEIRTVVFVRNADVVAEVLDRAKGFCEQCKAPAPFIRRSDGTPYLEVHHTKPLAEGGEDTVQNAVALCPNCHRHAHFA